MKLTFAQAPLIEPNTSNRARNLLFYHRMTKLLDEAVEAVRRLPSEGQDDVARVMLRLARGEEEPEPIDPAHLPAVLEGLAQARERDFATDSEVEAAFRRFDG